MGARQGCASGGDGAEGGLKEVLAEAVTDSWTSGWEAISGGYKAVGGVGGALWGGRKWSAGLTVPPKVTPKGGWGVSPPYSPFKKLHSLRVFVGVWDLLVLPPTEAHPGLIWTVQMQRLARGLLEVGWRISIFLSSVG